MSVSEWKMSIFFIRAKRVWGSCTSRRRVVTTSEASSCIRVERVWVVV